MQVVKVTKYPTRYDTLVAMVRHGIAEFGHAFIAGRIGNPVMARGIATNLGLHCCFRVEMDRYEFKAAPFPEPVGPERQLWRVIR